MKVANTLYATVAVSIDREGLYHNIDYNEKLSDYKRTARLLDRGRRAENAYGTMHYIALL